MTKTNERECVVCDSKFLAKTTGKYCSDQCKDTAARDKARLYYQNNLEVMRDRSRNQVVSLEKRMWKAARERASKQNLPFNLEVTDIFVPEVCPCFGVAMKRRTPYAPSLDRIEPDKGYVKDNIQVISSMANKMKSNATEQQLKDFASWHSSRNSCFGIT